MSHWKGRTKANVIRTSIREGNFAQIGKKNEPTPFLVSDEQVIKHFNPTLGSSLIASSAYQKWPTQYCHLFQKFRKATTADYLFKV